MLPKLLKKDEKHCWFSRTMAEMEDKSFFGEGECYYIIDGKVQRVTCASDLPNHGCNWNDMEYLGVGVFSHSTDTLDIYSDSDDDYYYDDCYYDQNFPP